MSLLYQAWNHVSSARPALLPLKLMISVKPLDVEMMKRLGTRVNLIPVIAKADTMTQEDLHNFKYIVRISALSIRIPADQ